METELEAVGCVIVGTATNVDAAVKLAESEDFDIALLDANLAGKSVEEVAAALTRRNVPFAFATGYGREGLPAAYREAPLLSKPFSPEQLVEAVRGLVSHAEPAPGVVRLRKR